MLMSDTADTAVIFLYRYLIVVVVHCSQMPYLPLLVAKLVHNIQCDTKIT